MEYDPYSDEAMAGPERLYEGLRAEGCPHFIESRKCWALTRFEDVQKASLAERSLDFTHGQTPGQLLLGEPVPRTFMTMNGADHRKWRGLVAGAYSAEAAAAEAPRHRRLIREVLAPLLPKGGFDVYRDFANRVMCINAGTTLGLPAGDGERLRGLIDEMMHREPGQVGAGSPRNQQAAGTLFGYLAQHVGVLRRVPQRAEGLARIFLEAEIDGVSLSDEDIVSYLFSLLVTGSETTPMAVAGTFYYLGRHPAQKRAVLEDRSLIDRAFAETLRFDQPTNMLARRARQDFEVGGKAIREGDNLLMIYAAANRDPARFERPHDYDIFREARRDLSFGAGPHYCLGAHLALLIGPMMIAELLDAVGDYELVEAECRRGYGEFLNGYVNVPIRFGSREGERMKIRGLGYIGVGAKEPKDWLPYATETLGLMPARAVAGEAWGTPAAPWEGPASKGSGIAPDGSVYLKMDDWQWRIAIHPGPGGLRYLGLEVAGPIELEQALDELRKAGHPAEMGSEAQARARSVSGIGHTSDPAGNAIELFFGPTIDRKFKSPQGVTFDTGDMGLGHANLLVDDLKAAQDFYTRVLGFRLTDYIRFGENMSANFYHCNPRHHSIGLTRVGPINGLHHVMLQVTHSDDVGRCLDRVMAAKVPITSTLGRHINDRMLSFYMRSPSGFDIEIGCEAIRVGDDWTPYEFVEGDVWGHKGLDAESIERAARGN